MTMQWESPGNWVKQDAWYRREIGDGTYLMVSRTTLNPCLVVHQTDDGQQTFPARWYWRLLSLDTGFVKASGLEGPDCYPDASAAMRSADERVKVREATWLATLPKVRHLKSVPTFKAA